MAGDLRDELSVVTDIGSDRYSDCGYCEGSECSTSHGMPVRTLTVYQYQDLIDQGWRRSGRYLYKPDLERTCCKAYTIRLDTSLFEPDKGQRRLLRKWRSFLSGQPGGAQFGVEGAGGAADADTAMEDAASPPAAAGPSSLLMQTQQAGGRAQQQQARPGARAHAHQTSGAAAAALAEERCCADDGVDARAQPLLDQVLAAALSAAIAAGALPPGEYPPPAVRPVTGKQRQALPAEVRFTSASAFPLAAAAARHAARVAANGATVSGSTASEAAACTQAEQGQQQRHKTAAPQAHGSLIPQEVAEVLARHCNALLSGMGGECSSRVGAAGDGLEEDAAAAPTARGSDAAAAVADMEVDGGAPGSLTTTLAAAALSGTAAAARLRVLCPAEAYTANGHINIRLATEAICGKPGQQQGHGAATTGAQGPAPEHLTQAAGVAAATAENHTDAVQERRRSGTDAGTSAIGAGAAPAGGAARAGGSTKSRKRQHGGKGAAALQPATQSARTGDGGPSRRGSEEGGRESAPAAAAAGSTAGAGAEAAAEALAVPSGRLQIRLVPSKFIEEEFQLYARYQVGQHKDTPEEVSREGFTRFLVDSPLRPVGRDSDLEAPPGCGYGSFHQQYWLDGKLIAVGVVDILPRCLSSVYLFWDPALPELALGRFTALQEIRWVLQHVPSCPGLRYYYMGFYIHTCAKMRYKAEYRPSDLLCPMRKVWVRITPELLRALEVRPYLELSAQPGAVCLPNLAAPPGDPAAMTGARHSRDVTNPGGGSADARTAAGQATAGADGAANGGGGGGGGELDVGETLLLLPGRGARSGPVRFEVLRRARLFPEPVLLELEGVLRLWRQAVGWTARTLVYQL